MNPKDAAARGERRCRLDLLEPVAMRQIADAMADGADKYGLRNFTEPGNSISYRVYLGAILRHAMALLDGEDFASDSGHHHLAHLGANVNVVLAAIAAGTLLDDRDPHAGAVATQEIPTTITEALAKQNAWADRVFGT